MNKDNLIDTNKKKNKNNFNKSKEIKKNTKVNKCSSSKNETIKNICDNEKITIEKRDKVIIKNIEFSLVNVVIIVIVVSLIVSFFTGIIVYRNYSKIALSNTKSNDDSIDLYEFIKSYNNILSSYVQEVDPKELLDAAISGMYNYLGDDYSMYLNSDITEEFQEQLVGEYQGIGLEITMNNDNQIVVNKVFSDSPAYKAKLKPGDILLKLNDEDMSSKDTSYFANIVKNGKKDEFSLTYMRNGKEYVTILKRQKVFIDSVESKVVDGIGYLKILTFSGTTSSQVEKKLKEFDDNITSLIIDLRDNTGGYLNAAYDISELLLNKGKIVYQLKNRDDKVTKYYSKKSSVREFDNIVIIINSNSASASEILTLALKENINAKVVGSKSFGKGTVQETEILSSGAMVKYTTSFWLSPKGNSINEVGISPDIEQNNDSKMLDEAIKAIK